MSRGIDWAQKCNQPGYTLKVSHIFKNILCPAVRRAAVLTTPHKLRDQSGNMTVSARQIDGQASAHALNEVVLFFSCCRDSWYVKFANALRLPCIDLFVLF